jgi:phenylacetic acid degradation operon negative regulatory protein
MSTVRQAAPTLLIYSLLSAYGDRRGGELPGAWLVAALDGLGHAAPAVRQTLFRMVRSHELEARRVGRANLYRLAPFARASTEAGRQKIFAAPERKWDGRWTLVHYRFDTRKRALRHSLRDTLEVEGFAALAGGLYIHPRDRLERIRSAVAASAASEQVMFFRADCDAATMPAALVPRLWNLADIDRRYRRFVTRYAPLDARPARDFAAAQAFAARLALVLEYLPPAWDDPELPDELLPAGWSGQEARRLARRLYEKLLPGTLRHGDALCTQLALGPLPISSVQEVRS